MFQSYYGMSCNPFLKEVEINIPYESNDYKELINRFSYLKEIKGIGVFTGNPGTGKTFAIRSFVNKLNSDLYKIIYISASKRMTLFDFFKEIGNSLNIDTGACYRTDMYHSIQNELKLLVEQDKVVPIIVIDDAQNLSREILLNLKILYEFEMDSKDYTSIYLIGKNEFRDEITKNIYDYLKQRIIVNYKMNGLTRQEVKEYVKTRLELADVNHNIFTEDALNALYSCSKSSPRRLNTIIINSLLLGCQNNQKEIDAEIIMNAKGEMDLE